MHLQQSEGIIFTAPPAAFDEIRPVYESIVATLTGRVGTGFAPYSDVIATYGASNRPTISREQMIVMMHEATCSFLPQLPKGPQGTYTITLRWNELMLPRCASLIWPLISRANIINKSLIGGKETMVNMRRFRTSEARFLKSQLSTGESGPLACYRPNATQIVNVVFTKGTPYTRVETSSVANYHRHFIDRAGGLEEAVYYLTTFPYKDLLFSLADPNVSDQKRRPGWILKHPQKRWALHHFDLCQIMREHVPLQTEEYYRAFAGILPPAVVELLQKELIERGFVIKCPSCQHTSWYPAEQVGQSFRCASCYETTIYPENPPWVFKMPEVLWLGFKQDMHVPLLALNHMKQQSRMQFAYVLDSNIYWQAGNEEKSGNLDIVCLCDGLLYVGEAKSNDKIDKDQTAFYHDVLQNLPIDGLIFATSELAWRPNTEVQIAELVQRWHDRIIALTGPQLEASARQAAMLVASRLGA